MSDQCPKCRGGATVRYGFPGGAPDQYGMRCASCGAVWSPYFCATRKCTEQAAGLCQDCFKPFCLRHGQLGRTALCDVSRRKLRAVIRGVR